MKRVFFIIFFVLLPWSIFAHELRAQDEQAQTTTPAAQPASPDADKTASQRHYDPLAGRQHLRGGIWDNALAKINPDNKDYGECVNEWRRVAVSATLENYVFWVAILMSGSLLFCLCFVYWLLHDRARRLHVSVEILTQIANAYIDAKAHALDAIQKHNTLADDYNVMAEKMAALELQKSNNLKRARGVPSETTTDDPSLVTQESSTSTDVSQTNERVNTESEVQTRQRFANQISALQEKNKTLRNSLNEALAQLDAFKRQGMNRGA